MMTRKDFQGIADAFALARLSNERHADGSKTHFATRDATLALTARLVADNLAASNPRFDRARFLAACKITGA